MWTQYIFWHFCQVITEKEKEKNTNQLFYLTPRGKICMCWHLEEATRLTIRTFFFYSPSPLPFIISLSSHCPTRYCSCDSLKHSGGQTRPIYLASLVEIKTDTAAPLLTPPLPVPRPPHSPPSPRLISSQGQTCAISSVWSAIKLTMTISVKEEMGLTSACELFHSFFIFCCSFLSLILTYRASVPCRTPDSRDNSSRKMNGGTLRVSAFFKKFKGQIFI